MTTSSSKGKMRRWNAIIRWTRACHNPNKDHNENRLHNGRSSRPPLCFRVRRPSYSIAQTSTRQASMAQNATPRQKSAENIHNEFVESFQKHMVRTGWPESVSKELNWTVERVEEHAYMYLVALAKCDPSTRRAGSVSMHDNLKTPSANNVVNTGANRINPESALPDLRTANVMSKSKFEDDPTAALPQKNRLLEESMVRDIGAGRKSSPLLWTAPEKAFLELVIVREELEGSDQQSAYTWEDRVAQEMVGRTASQVRNEIRGLEEDAQRVKEDLKRRKMNEEIVL